ncbi:MAG: 16S rRNA (guanine(966)-N(2))-methyltransferase RsmD [Bacilli bacterium]|nr:16S rRNA (guanine(966)-N(2))-methyltransferase RsmD [Bacilli bacterium]
MLKIIGGKYGSRIIDTPDIGTVPTKNMVRGAMLSCLGDIEGLSALDLFAGSGALGIEALSRGASDCTFVDNAPKTAQIIKNNLKKLGEEQEVLNLDYLAALKRLAGDGKRFDIVFLDPPYALKEAYQNSLDALLELDLLAEGAKIVLEYEGDLAIDRSPYAHARDYKYGKTKVLLLRRN